MAALALIWLGLGLASPAFANGTHIAAELIAESAVRPGGTVLLAVHMRPAKGWHGYWSNPGDAGTGMTFAWSLPPGATAGPVAYPVPQALLYSGLMNHVYEQDYALLVPLNVPRTVPVGARLPIGLKAEWLACTELICVPEQGELNAEIAIGEPGQRDPRFDGWRQAIPAPLGSPARFAVAGGTLRLGIPLPATVALDAPHLFVADDGLVDYAGAQAFARQGNLLIVTVPRGKFEPLVPQSVHGVLRLNPAGDGVAITAAPGVVPPGGDPVGSGTAELPALPILLLMALAGGLLLNVMPCVFPILSLKALSLARAGASESHARNEGLAYTAGVVVACLALGGLLLGLRAAGQQVGWAFQLQEPLVVAGLLLLAGAITANLLGLYEIAIPGFARNGSPQGAFATGLLAAFVATPCTGPFMAAAMGAALLLPVLPALLLFAALGLGIALPFLALALIPVLRRRMPRPGPWMERFRHWMAVPMALTALALLWLCSRIGGTGFALGAGALTVALILALTLAGSGQRQGVAVARRLSIALAVLALGFAFVLPGLVRNPTEAGASLIKALPFSQAALDRARAAGRPVFVYMTADWCLTCKVNEGTAIERAETRAAFARASVTVLRGDWTRRDPAITRFLTEHGAAGVPLYLWYPAGGGEPRQLPQLLGGPGLFEDLTGGGGD